MPVLKLRSHIGEDGMLHLDIPPEFKGQEVDVTVTVEPILCTATTCIFYSRTII
jgi:hypothetical protein